MVSMIGREVIDPLFKHELLSNKEEWILKMSAGYASLAGNLDCSREICLNDFACLDKSSKHIILSNPLSLNLSAIDIPINGIIKESKDDEEECVLSMKENQLTNNKEEINFDNLLSDWLQPTYRPNNLFVPNPSIVPKLFIDDDWSKVDRNKLVLPVYRSPKINCLCPRPTGSILSTILNPVIKESFTLALKDILIPLFKRLS